MLCKHPYIFVLFLDTVKQIALKRGNSVQRPKEFDEADKEFNQPGCVYNVKMD